MNDTDFDSLAHQALSAPQAAPMPNNEPDYGDLAGQVMNMQSDIAKHNLITNQDADPQKAARALQLSKQTGIPQPAVEENLPQVEQSAKLQQNIATLNANPNLASFVASNPLAARIAQDDFDKLGFLEKTWDAIKSGASGAFLQNEMGRLGNIKEAAGIAGQETPVTDTRINAIQQSLAQQPQLTKGFGFVQNFTGFLTGLVDNAVQGGMQGSLYGGMAGATAGAMAGGIGALPGAVAGAGVGGAIGFNADMGRVAAGNAYLKLKQMRGTDGQQISETGAQFGAIFTGAATYAIGAYATALESKFVGETAESLAQKAIQEAVSRPTFTSAMANFAKQTAKGAATGAGVMTAMEGSSIIGDEIAKTMSSGDFKTDPQEIISRLADAAVNGAVLLGTLHSGMAGLGLYGDFRSAQRAEANMQMFKNLQDGSATSKLRERDMQAFQDFMQRQTEGSPVENLYIPAEKIREFYQGMGIDQATLADREKDPLFGFVKDMPQQLSEAAQTGGDVVIPSADYLTHLAGTPVSEKLLPDIRVGADAMSVNEAKAFTDEYKARVQQATEDAAKSAEESPTSGIAEDVSAQAKAAGYSETVAGAYGKILESRYATRGERLGVDPIELYKQANLKIQKGEETPSTGDIKQFQQGEETPRGSIRFEDGKTVINLFDKANTSTLMHESSHMFLEELIADAKRSDAPQQLKDDLQAVLGWMGIDSADKIETQHHEQFARAGEAYLMEGKAPGGRLAAVFSRFKTWLTKIYQSVTNLNTPINPEIREVFDRLLATDAEIEQAKKSQGLEPAFRSKEEAGMTSAEWKSYLSMIDKANRDAESKLLDKAMAKIRRQRTVEYKEERAKIIDEVSKDIDKRPDIQALTLLTKGVMPDGTEEKGAKLSRADIEATYGKKGVTDLPKGVTAKDGVHPDYVAEMLGFSSGDDMIKALQNLEQQQREVRLQEGERRGIRQYLIDQAADQRMSETHGDIMDEATMRDEALAAVHSDKQAELLAMEMRYLKRSNVQSILERGKGRKEVKQAKTQADWDVAQERLMGEIDKAKVEGKSQDIIDKLNQKLGDLKMEMRWDQAEENTTQAKLKESVASTREMLDAIREQAEKTLSGKTVKEIGDFNRYARDERKAAREVQEAILKKDFAAAAAAKQRQIISHILYMKARDASAEADSGTAMMQRLAKKKTFNGISQEYTDQIHGLLERFGVKTVREPDELMRGLDGKSLSDFAQDKFSQGYELPITQNLATGSGHDPQAMKLSDFRELTDMVRSMQSVGREEQSIRIGDKTMEKTWAIAELITALGELKQRQQSDFYRPEDKGVIAEKRDKAASFMRSLNAALLKKEQLFDWMDGNNPDGPFNRLIFRPLKEAQHRENERRAEVVKAFRDIKESMPKEWSRHLDDSVQSALINQDTGNPFKFTRKRMLSIALNWGNEDNAAKLADGYKWDQRSVQSFLDANMTSDDWHFVQSVFDTFEKFRPDIDALQRRVTGVGIEFVEPRALHTKFGDYRGGYFPLVYDASKALVAERNLERSRDALLENQYQRATTRNGSTISRVQNVRQPVNLDLDVIPWKIGQTIHDLAFREALMNADKLLGDKDVIKAMDDSLGPEYRKLMRPWLQHIANAQNINDAAMSFSDKFLNAARTNAVMVGIGFRATTMLKHGFTALSNSVGELGPRWMGAGIKEMFGTPEQMKRTWNWVMSMSDELKFRKDNYDRDIGKNLESLTGEGALSKINRGMQEYGHLGVATLDMMSAVPTWIGAFRKAQSEGMNEADSVYAADKMVRKAHGAQGVIDKSAFQDSQSQIYKLTGMFYGFFNHIYNRQADTVRTASMIPDKVRSGDFRGAGNDFAQVLSRSVYYLIIPALAEALWSSGPPSENKEEGWLGWAGKAIAAEIPAGIPILRDIAKAAIEGHDYEVSPLARAVKTITGSGKDISSVLGLRDKEPSDRALQHAMETFGYFTGSPTGQAGASAQFLWDVAQGNQDPQSTAEWVQGLMHGKTGVKP